MTDEDDRIQRLEAQMNGLLDCVAEYQQEAEELRARVAELEAERDAVVAAAREETWIQARNLACCRIGASSNGHEAYLTSEIVEMLCDDIAENFNVAAEPKGLDWLQGKCTLDEYEAARKENQ